MGLLNSDITLVLIFVFTHTQARRHGTMMSFLGLLNSDISRVDCVNARTHTHTHFQDNLSLNDGIRANASVGLGLKLSFMRKSKSF